MKRERTLAELCENLNVDKTPEEIAEEHDELTLVNEGLKYSKEEMESDLGDYKIELEELKEKIKDFKEWIREVNFENSYSSIDIALDDVSYEFKKLFDI